MTPTPITLSVNIAIKDVYINNTPCEGKTYFSVKCLYLPIHGRSQKCTSKNLM